MAPQIQIIVLLFVVVAAAAVLAARLKTPPAILLVVIGVLLGLIPGLPRIELAPELVLLIVLPPVVYSSSFPMSWREFRFGLRPIALLDLSWAIGFVLGTSTRAWRNR
jgi:monovalent cation/hydrogen antiporter